MKEVDAFGGTHRATPGSTFYGFELTPNFLYNPTLIPSLSLCNVMQRNVM